MKSDTMKLNDAESITLDNLEHMSEVMKALDLDS